MALKEFYEIYKLHREYSKGDEISKDDPRYIEDDFERKYSSNPDSFEDHTSYYVGKMEKSLYKDHKLCLEVFKSFDLDFFFWFTFNFCNWFEQILDKHKKLELLETLKNHVDSFDHPIATEHMNEIYNNAIKFCK